MGLFYGFKLYLIIDDRDEFLALKLTLDNVVIEHLPKLSTDIFEKPFGYKAYKSQELLE